MARTKQTFGLGGLVGFVVLVLVGILVAYQVYTQLSAQLSNVSGLWSVAATLLAIVIPVVFILMVIRLLS